MHMHACMRRHAQACTRAGTAGAREHSMAPALPAPGTQHTPAPHTDLGYIAQIEGPDEGRSVR